MRGCHAVPYECLNMGHNLNWERTWISLSSKLDSRVVQYFKSTVHERIQNVFGRIVFHEHKRANVKIIKKIWNNFSLTLSNRYFHIFMEFPQDYLLWLYEANRRTCVASGSYKNKYRAQWCGGGMNICSRYQETRAYLLAASAKMRWFECQEVAWYLLACAHYEAAVAVAHWRKSPAGLMSDWDLTLFPDLLENNR